MKSFPILNEEQTDSLVVNTLQWSLANGLVMYPPNFQQYSADNAPISLFPTPIPKSSFEDAINIQQTYNELYSNVITKDKKWLVQNIEQLSRFDKDFTGKLFDIYKTLINENGKVPQPLSLGIFRSDYMIHEADNNQIKQIEFNTVSVSFGGLSTKVNQLHNYLNKSGAYDTDYSYKYYDDAEIPISSSIDDIAKALSIGNYYYNGEVENDKTVVLFIVQPNERNSFDQRHIEYSLINNFGLKSVRLTLEEVSDKTTVNSNKLYLKQTMDEISVVYYRSGYAPTDYVSEECWKARLHLENNVAIKCPSILTQLAGAKKIQQILTNKQVLETFLPDLSETELEKVLSTFVKIYPLDDSEEGKIAKQLIKTDPGNFVLKPQREGGGNNIYKEDIPSFLEKLEEKDWGAYILMELITPPIHKNKLLRNDQIFEEDIISELGVFGTILFDESKGDIKYNETSGFLLRSKFSSSNEGGVAAGFGCVDGVYLY
ncbi:Glutathione synthetase [Yamadazyma tenuis]|uniref:Glutathione synthetase n=1 Tax=Candida tenuis (strain ATCC 10573 / BCRC 21748 / CBS 615 / JCM 9827 / NBRC 10315 / NRRL Y-1498 / VKM Y-70) TaxID=590646 RepID=G3B2H8_CANTC|nr:glutathione synthetase [Yamadazyma tenuis ATCC 10573]EGV64679.1 glutathione synthetase [Yamadazyma tenuis ATCC 10573]WEJ97468.1 Glutathione synthetase [Yamadazyma tenuis]